MNNNIPDSEKKRTWTSWNEFLEGMDKEGVCEDPDILQFIFYGLYRPLESAESEIEDLRGDIKVRDWDIKEYKKEIQSLRKENEDWKRRNNLLNILNDQYIKELDELRKENERLIEENRLLIHGIAEEKNKNERLKELIEKAIEYGIENNFLEFTDTKTRELYIQEFKEENNIE